MYTHITRREESKKEKKKIFKKQVYIFREFLPTIQYHVDSLSHFLFSVKATSRISKLRLFCYFIYFYPCGEKLFSIFSSSVSIFLFLLSFLFLFANFSPFFLLFLCLSLLKIGEATEVEVHRSTAAVRNAISLN